MLSPDVTIQVRLVNPISGTTNYYTAGTEIQGEAVIVVKNKALLLKCIDFMLDGHMDFRMRRSTNMVLVTVHRTAYITQAIVGHIPQHRISGSAVTVYQCLDPNISHHVA